MGVIVENHNIISKNLMLYAKMSTLVDLCPWYSEC